MKKLLVICMVALFNISITAQSSIYINTENIQQAVESNEFLSLMKTLKTDIVITNPLYDASNPELQKIYQIECDCDVVDLYSAMYDVPGLTWIKYELDDEMFPEADKNNIKAAFAGELTVYDMNGNQVNLEYAPAGMYVIIDNGITTKIVK